MDKNHYSPGLCLLIMLQQPRLGKRKKRMQSGEQRIFLCFYACQVQISSHHSPGVNVNYTLKNVDAARTGK